MSLRVKCRADKDLDRIGETRLNNQGCLMKIVEYFNCNKIVIEFQDEYKFRKYCAYRDFQNGEVKNNFYPSVCGIGYIGNTEVSINRKVKTSYAHWRNMLTRCYDEKYKKKKQCYNGCIVCDEWLCYANFEKWFDKNYYIVNNEIMNLDKDILIKNNKTYSPETCVFVPVSINDLFVKGSRGKKNEHLGLIGVTCKNSKYFCTVGNNYSSFDNKEDAFLEYKKYKENRIKDVANEYKNKIPSNIYNILINYKVERGV